MNSRIWKFLCAAAVTLGLVSAVASAAGSGGPKTSKGKAAQLVASGVATPTAFAFGDGQVFFSDGTPPGEAPGIGGVYVIKAGHAVKLLGSPAFSFGVTWHKGTLYVSAINQIQAWSGWTGVTFTKHKTIYTGPKGFPGFNGLAFGADGRLYAGVDVGQKNDHGPAKSAPDLYDVLSMTATGKNVKVVAQGMRQPWQLAFPAGSSSPYVTDLGQDAPKGVNPPDFVLRVKAGQNYGFPRCTWIKASACGKYAKPLVTFKPHTDPMGVTILGSRLFVTNFGVSTPAQVVSVPLSGGKPRLELGGFPKGSNIVGLGSNGGWIYVAQTASSPTQLGSIYRFKP